MGTSGGWEWHGAPTCSPELLVLSELRVWSCVLPQTPLPAGVEEYCLQKSFLYKLYRYYICIYYIYEGADLMTAWGRFV